MKRTTMLILAIFIASVVLSTLAFPTLVTTTMAASENIVVASGRNDVGQLGDGSMTDSNSPVRVLGLSGATMVDAGHDHCLALNADRTVSAWGDNSKGELGDGTTTNSTTPVQVAGLNGVMAISAGVRYSLALRDDGTVWAWGDNRFGKLGNGTTTNSTTPVPVSDLSGVTAIAAGFNHGLALKSDKTVWAWGYNHYGQLGNGTITDSSIPVPVTGLSDVVALAGGADHTLAVKGDGTVWACGWNADGQLGDGTNVTRLEPVQVVGLSGVIAVAAGQYHSLAITGDETLWAWGYNNYGQLGDGTTTSSNTPLQVSSLSGATAVAAGAFHSMALLADGTAWAWGYNQYGQLGNPAAISSAAEGSGPVQVSGPTNVTGISAGYAHSLLICPEYTNPSPTISSLTPNHKTAGGLSFTLTVNGSGFMNGSVVRMDGLNRTTHYKSDTQLTAEIPSTDLTILGTKNVTVCNPAPGGGISNEMAFTVDSNVVMAWGSGVAPFLPEQVPGISGVTAISAGGGHALAIKSDRTAWAWGSNFYGQLGDGTTTYRATPVWVSSLNSVAEVSAGGSHSLAIASGFYPWAWGGNSRGQLGDGTTENRTTPVPVSPLANGYFQMVSGGEQHSLAVKNDMTVWAWGCNRYGQLGDGTLTDSAIPLQVSGLDQVVAVAGGADHSLALKRDGTVWAWGLNSAGQLGIGTPDTNKVTPVQIPGLSGVTAIDAGYDHSLALKSDGTVWAWGYNAYGQLGDGTTTNRKSPVQVSSLSGVRAVSAGDYHNLALKGDETAWAWGSNVGGELGDGTTTQRNTPVRVSISNKVVAISAGGGSLAICSEYSNSPPVMETIGDRTVNEGQQLQFTVSATDPDSDPLTYSASGLPAGATLDDETGAFSWSPDYTQAGNYQVTLRVSDGSLTASEDITITVNNVGYDLTLSVSGNGYTDPAVGTHTCQPETDVGIEAHPDTGWHFLRWSGDVGTVADVNAASTTITMNGDYSITAEFAINTCTITASADPPDGGTITGTGTYDFNQEATLTASPNPGYEFVNWSEGDTIVSTNATYTFPATSDRTLVAHFSKVNTPGCISGFGLLGTGYLRPFGFRVQYTAGASGPVGTLAYADLTPRKMASVTSSSFNWLVISGNQAFATGICTYNGTRGCAFKLEVVDNVKGPNIKDTMHLVVYGLTGQVVYEMQGTIIGDIGVVSL
jgi:alpha-tubulin suppressor-like RCC1 family protein